MSYEPDCYHQTTPPCELKSVVLGRLGSKKKPVTTVDDAKKEFDEALANTSDQSLIDSFAAMGCKVEVG